MKPFIPLSPQQQRQRRKNILFFCATAGVSMAIIAYLFFPDGDNKKDTPAQPAAAAPADSGHTEGDAGEPAWGSYTAPGAYTGSEQAASSSDYEPPQATSSRPAEDDTQLSEEELAKLPPWQAAFARLEVEHRLAFATAFAKAKAAYNAEQWSNCLALLNDCDLIYSGSPNVWNLRACALLATNALEEAETCIKRSLELNPEDTVALMCHSELLMLRRDFKGSIRILEQLRHLHTPEEEPALHDAFTFHQLLCHLMLRQEMEARALVTNLTPLSDSPLYYFSESAFHIYQGENQKALEPLRSAGTIFGNGGVTASYRKWLSKCGLAEKYVRNKRN